MFQTSSINSADQMHMMFTNAMRIYVMYVSEKKMELQKKIHFIFFRFDDDDLDEVPDDEPLDDAENEGVSIPDCPGQVACTCIFPQWKSNHF